MKQKREPKKRARGLDGAGVKQFVYVHKKPQGVHCLAKTTKIIAEYLTLPEPAKYTFHGLRRTGATLFIAGGGSKAMLKIANLSIHNRCHFSDGTNSSFSNCKRSSFGCSS